MIVRYENVYVMIVFMLMMATAYFYGTNHDLQFYESHPRILTINTR
jgi:hypothetical protein